ncbi:hypothetical protein [Streptomyces sp. NBC_00443]|uniref:hypothetical protein n=1 Tax=Streptomyces sp. NBC_00443 TaxID=2975743 RepID=UPI002E1CFDC0
MTADTDLDDLLAALPPLDTRKILDEIQAARRRAESAPPPSVIPPPEHVFPNGRRWSSPVLAFPCPHRCGWAHLEDPVVNDLEEACQPFVIPAGTEEEMTRAFNARADARAEALRARIENGIREHLGTAHSDHDGVRTLGARPQSSPPAGSHGAAPPSSPPMAGPPYVRGES